MSGSIPQHLAWFASKSGLEGNSPWSQLSQYPTSAMQLILTSTFLAFAVARQGSRSVWDTFWWNEGNDGGGANEMLTLLYEFKEFMDSAVWEELLFGCLLYAQHVKSVKSDFVVRIYLPLLVLYSVLNIRSWQRGLIRTPAVALGSSRPFHSDVHQTLAVDLAGRSPKAWLHSGATPPKCHDRKVVDSGSEAWHQKLDSICLEWFRELAALGSLYSVG